MRSVVEVFGGVFVLRRIAAAYVSARETEAKVNPGVAKFHALLADVGGGGSDFYLIQVLALLRHSGISSQVARLLASSFYRVILLLRSVSLPRSL